MQDRRERKKVGFENLKQNILSTSVYCLGGTTAEPRVRYGYL